MLADTLSDFSYSDVYALDRWVFDKRTEGLPYEEIIGILHDYLEYLEEVSAE